MKVSIRKFIVGPKITGLEAMKAIDDNAYGFILLADEAGTFLGVLTDGDIRRALISGFSLNSSIEPIINTKAKVLKITDDSSAITELFKKKAIHFLPIVDEEGKLVNLITKRQLYSLLLQDIDIRMDYDFMSLDESAVDYEIFSRPWGFYRTTVMNDYFQSKVIHVNPGAKLSLQSHNHREEHWIIAHGHGIVQIGESQIDVRCGTALFIPKGCKHRLINTDDKESLIITEVQIGDYFGEDDIIRYEDEYGRT